MNVELDANELTIIKRALRLYADQSSLEKAHSIKHVRNKFSDLIKKIEDETNEF